VIYWLIFTTSLLFNLNIHYKQQLQSQPLLWIVFYKLFLQSASADTAQPLCVNNRSGLSRRHPSPLPVNFSVNGRASGASSNHVRHCWIAGPGRRHRRGCHFLPLPASVTTSRVTSSTDFRLVAPAPAVLVLTFTATVRENKATSGFR
jgi:hypothetical protein